MNNLRYADKENPAIKSASPFSLSLWDGEGWGEGIISDSFNSPHLNPLPKGEET